MEIWANRYIHGKVVFFWLIIFMIEWARGNFAENVFKKRESKKNGNQKLVSPCRKMTEVPSLFYCIQRHVHYKLSLVFELKMLV